MRRVLIGKPVREEAAWKTWTRWEGKFRTLLKELGW
jgi:hypothetical protein